MKRLAFTLLLMLVAYAAPGAPASYVKRDTREETRAASQAALAKEFGLDHFQQGPWHLVGPFDNQRGAGLNTAFPPELGVDLKAEYTGFGGRKIRWQMAAHLVDGETHDLSLFDERDFVTTYLYRTIESPADMAATISVGSDDCVTVWVNGAKVHDFRAVGGGQVDRDVVPVRLKKGTNTVLLKVSNLRMGYGFSYRLSTLDAAGLERLRNATKEIEDQLARDFASPEADYYRVETIPIPPDIVLEVGGMDFSSDGRLMMCTRRGEVWSWRPGTTNWSRFAAGLHEPLGLAAEGSNAVVVAQRPELTRVRDTDGDGRADSFETMADVFGLSGNYHEFHFGVGRDRAGNYYGTLNLAFVGVMASLAPLRGWAYQVTPAGEFVPWALGFRSPFGVGVSPEDELFVVDSQGDWWGTSPLLHVPRGKFFGHPGGLRWTQNYNGPEDTHFINPESLKPIRTPPALWFPYGEMGVSPGQPVWDTSGGKFGPFAGQMIVGDSGKSALYRVALEKVGGEYQGAVFPFRAGFASGISRGVFDGAGNLYVGMTDRGWGSTGGRPYGLQRVSWTGRVPFEVHSIKATKTGFDLRFTKPVAPATATAPARYSIQRYHYLYYREYGSAKVELTAVTPTAARVSADGLTVSLDLPALEAGKVYQFHLGDLRAADGGELLHSDAAYTLNRVPTP